MTQNTTPTEPNRPTTNWAVTYDVDPIRIRDPVAEALCVLDPGEPFVVTYEDVVTAAGHSCPTAAGAYRIAQIALEELYQDALPVRSEIEVVAAGPREDATYGVMGRLIGYVTGAAGVGGFGGLAGGYGGRRNTFTYDGFDADGPSPTFRFSRTDTGKTVEVTYHVGNVPDAGPAVGILPQILDGTASEDDRQAFAEAWHGRVRAVLGDDGYFSTRVIEP